MDTRKDFVDTWLFETDMGIPSTETYKVLSYIIKDLLKTGLAPEKLSGDLNKLVICDLIYYWHGTGLDINVAVELQKKPHGYIVSMTGKDPELKGQAPWTSDLYSAIVKDIGRSIRLLNDANLSDEGCDIWKNLFDKGHKIMIYSAKNPGQTMISFYSIEEMNEFFKNNLEKYQGYQYVLSENKMKMSYTRALFNTRRYRELTEFI